MKISWLDLLVENACCEFINNAAAKSIIVLSLIEPVARFVYSATVCVLSVLPQHIPIHIYINTSLSLALNTQTNGIAFNFY